jgi:hypothetical protein
MVPCPFVSCPSKKQLCAWHVFRKKVAFVKSSCLRVVEMESFAV